MCVTVGACVRESLRSRVRSLVSSFIFTHVRVYVFACLHVCVSENKCVLTSASVYVRVLVRS